MVLDNVFTPEECDEYMERTFDIFKTISPLLDLEYVNGNWKDIIQNWDSSKLPYQTRPGLFQRLMGQIQPVWDVRTDERVRAINTELYSGLRGEKVTRFVCSHDGINIHPPPTGDAVGFVEPRDWMHVDQTFLSEDDCIQGQLVLSDSSAGFRASSRSHLLLPEIKQTYGIDEPSNFHMFKPDEYEDLEKRVIEKGGEFQRVFRAPRGSMIFWFSRTFHSATVPTPGFSFENYPATNPKWLGWRGVYYVCYRPADEVSTTHKLNLRHYFYNNRTSNHWGERAFKDRPRYVKKNRFTTNMFELMGNPANMHIKYPTTKPHINQKIEHLLDGD